MPKQDVAVELFYDSAWHNLVDSDEVLADTPIVIKRGQGDESPAPRPSTVNLRLDNTSDRFRTTNPVSPLYGKAGLNTPLRVSVGDSVRAYTETSSWRCGQSSDFRAFPRRGKAWTDIEAGGPLRRINQWTHNVRSPLREFDDANLTENVIGRWPLEDKPGTTVPAALVPGSSSTGGTEIAFGSQIRAPGTEPLVDIGGPNGSLAFTMAPTPPGSTAWQFSTVQRLPNLDSGTFPFLFDLTLADTTDIIVTLDTDNALISFLAQTTTGTELASAEADLGDLTATRIYVLQFVQNGTSIDVTLLWRAVDDPAWLFVSDSYTGTVSPLTRAAFFGGDLPEGTTIGHVTAIASATPDLSSNARGDAFAGHPGERASYRFGRLCDAAGITYYVSPSFDTSQKMGPQNPDSLAGQMEEIATTEDGLIYDYRTEGRLFLRSRGDRYNQTAALTLDASGTDHGLPALPEEVTDDLPVHNLVTAKQRGGGDYTAEDSTSPMGTQDPPDGRGIYKQDVDVNVYRPSADLRQQAYWWLGRGTVDLPRYPSVTVDLGALPAGRVADVEAVDVGDVIEITGYRENTIRLHVLGYTETIGTHSRTITFTCEPDRQFVVGVYDAATSRYDLRSSTLNAAATATATSLTFKQTSDESWSTTGTPYDVFAGGEQMTVTAMGARSGSGPWTQTATVVRSVNGVVKAQAAGTPVRIATPGRWAL